MEEKEVCQICGQGLKNPVCNKCRFKEFQYWINESSIDKRIKGKILKEIKKIFNYDIISDTNCIICSNEYLNLCSYCYFHEIYKILKKYKVTRKDINPFLETFNYKFFEDEYEDLNDFEDIYQKKYLNPYLNNYKIK